MLVAARRTWYGYAALHSPHANRYAPSLPANYVPQSLLEEEPSKAPLKHTDSSAEMDPVNAPEYTANAPEYTAGKSSEYAAGNAPEYAALAAGNAPEYAAASNNNGSHF